MDRFIQRRRPSAESTSQCRKRSIQPDAPRPDFSTRLSEPRLLCSDLLSVRLSGAGVISREIDALLEEISPRSASLQFEESIPIGATIRLLYTESEEGGNLVGTVVDCMRHAQLGYFIEIRFVNGCTWSPQRFRPLHLFDPANLIAIARAAAGGQ